jgi:hypothetical protein
MTANPFLFPAPLGGLNYSRFAQGEFGSNTNSAVETGMASTPEGQFQVAPGSPIPTAFGTEIGNELPPSFGLGKVNKSQ